ncbi:hypothetical protein NDU88_004888 [Pleurodeles waltl]|uniref:Uncharacterized protein n=1 Tax=Pleurodeles waltl TaxID=8319 RepID=A0AAV7L157_PLEWA|nr:hypothetical protein NDU88_004888 [Pleurodeles waltl]
MSAHDCRWPLENGALRGGGPRAGSGGLRRRCASPFYCRGCSEMLPRGWAHIKRGASPLPLAHAVRPIATCNLLPSCCLLWRPGPAQIVGRGGSRKSARCGKDLTVSHLLPTSRFPPPQESLAHGTGAPWTRCCRVTRLAVTQSTHKLRGAEPGP